MEIATDCPYYFDSVNNRAAFGLGCIQCPDQGIEPLADCSVFEGLFQFHLEDIETGILILRDDGLEVPATLIHRRFSRRSEMIQVIAL